VDETWELKKEAIEHQNLSMLNNLSFLSMTCSGFLKLSWNATTIDTWSKRVHQTLLFSWTEKSTNY